MSGVTPEERGFELACMLSEIPTMLPRKVSIKGRSVLICRGEQGVFAVDELCSHKSLSMAFGVVHEGKIICPHHQYTFDLDTGRCSMRRCAPINTYPVEVVDEEVFVKIG